MNEQTNEKPTTEAREGVCSNVLLDADWWSTLPSYEIDDYDIAQVEEDQMQTSKKFGW